MSASTKKNNKLELKEILAILFEHFSVPSGSELARKLDLPAPTVNRLLSGYVTDPRSSTLVTIANYFDVTVGQLIGTEPLPEGLVSDDVEIFSKARLPLANLSKFDPNEANHNATDYFSLKSDINIKNPAAFAVKIDNDNFEPAFCKDTILIVDPEAKPTDRDYVLIQLSQNTACSIKKIIFDGSDRYLYPIVSGWKVINFDDSKHNLVGVIIESHFYFKDV